MVIIYVRIISKNEDPNSLVIQESQKETPPTRRGKVEANLVNQTTELTKDGQNRECTKSKNHRPYEKIKTRWIRRYEKETFENVEKITFLCQECQESWKCKKKLE